MVYLIIFLISSAMYTFSTVSGGGGAMSLVPIFNFYLNPQWVAPILNLGNFIGRPFRIFLFWKYIEWKITLVFVPAAVVGAYLGVYFYVNISLEWLKLVIALFLLSTVAQYWFGKKKESFNMKLIYFLPLGLVISFISSMVGAMGPVLNPFYLNYHITKERMIATKAANAFLVGVVQIGTYLFFDALNEEMWYMGGCVGAGYIAGTVIGKRLLKGMKITQFNNLVIAVMLISGTVMLIQFFKP